MNLTPTIVKLQQKVELFQSIKQYYAFSENECKQLEIYVDSVVEAAAAGQFKQKTVEKTFSRDKYFFGERYTYGTQLPQKGLGQEKLYPKQTVDPIPDWIQHLVISRLVNNQLIPQDFINSAIIVVYRPGGCIVSHIDPPHIFDRPIISLNLFSESALSFGCKFKFKPIRCSEPVFQLGLPRGIVTLLSGFAANQITHCVRPVDIRRKRAAIILRRVLPAAPRLEAENLENIGK